MPRLPLHKMCQVHYIGVVRSLGMGIIPPEPKPKLSLPCFVEGRTFFSGHFFLVKKRAATAVGYPPTAISYPPTAVGYPPTAVGYPGRGGWHSGFMTFCISVRILRFLSSFVAHSQRI